MGKEAKAPPIDDDLLTVSTRTDDVSCRLGPLDRRGPAETFKETVANQTSPKVCGPQLAKTLLLDQWTLDLVGERQLGWLMTKTDHKDKRVTLLSNKQDPDL